MSDTREASISLAKAYQQAEQYEGTAITLP